MDKNSIPYFTFHISRFPSYIREWVILIGFILLTMIMLFPLSFHLSNMVPEPTDPLLNAWRMQWNARAFLSGPTAIANLFNTNIFYPFPLTLAYSEHFLMIAAQALPFLVFADSHLVGMNLSVLFTFVLSGYGMYLLMTGWTGNCWAGLVAGVLFAYSPHRFGQLNHLELLVTQWLPLTLLALHWTLTRPGVRYAFLFGIFFNLQALSGFHYALNLTIACALLVLIYALFGRIHWRRGLWGAAALSILATLLLNWPIWRMYLRFSDVMGAVRTPGEVRVYSAALTDYFTAIPYNLLYGWTFGRWQPDGHQFQPLMPVGIAGFLLAIIGLFPLITHTRRLKKAQQLKPARVNYTVPSILFLLLLTFVSLLLSFGINENALGPGLSPILKYSPYFWLYENIPAFQGIRVPGRYGILAVLGLAGLAGWGVVQLSTLITKIQKRRHQSFNNALRPPQDATQSRAPISNSCPEPGRRNQLPLLSLVFIFLILLESWSAPLVGPEFPGGQTIAPIYHWLQQETPADAVVLELPFEGPSEFLYEYYSSYHWRRMANGGTGYTPPIYKELRHWFNTFPDPRSMDVIQQMGIDYVVLHPNSYAPNDWQRVLAELPLYLPAIEQLYQVDDVLVLRIAKPLCQPNPDAISVDLTPTQVDGLFKAMAVSYLNSGPAAYVADVQQVSSLIFEDGTEKNFIEPLIAPAGEAQSVTIPLHDAMSLNTLTGAQLTSLNRQITTNSPQFQSQIDAVNPNAWLPLGLKYAGGPQLMAYQIVPEAPAACSILTVALQWVGGQAGDAVLVQLLDPFSRVVAESASQPWEKGGGNDIHNLALVGSLPAGKYGLRVFVKGADGSERMPITEDGVTIPTDQIPPLPVTVHPIQRPIDSSGALAKFGDTITLLGGEIVQEKVLAGDWLRFSLKWQVEQPTDADLTVFTQLLSPEGQVWGQRDNLPGGGWYALSLWQPGRPVIDHYAFQLQPDAPPGMYRLIAGLYRSDTLERLPVENGGDFIEIGTVVAE